MVFETRVYGGTNLLIKVFDWLERIIMQEYILGQREKPVWFKTIITKDLPKFVL